MNELHLIQEIDRYLNGEMSAAERAAFESLRSTNPEIDQQVVSHQVLLQQFSAHGNRKMLMHKMDKIHAGLDVTAMKEDIQPQEAVKTPTIFSIRRKTLLNLTAAACIALFTSLTTIYFMQDASHKSTVAQFEGVKRELTNIQNSQKQLITNINDRNKKGPVNPGQFGGTCFAITRNGYMITNYHVVAGADSIYIQNTKGESFKAVSIFEDVTSDLAIIRVVDSSFKNHPLPYTLKPEKVNVGEDVFTMGFPRDEIVYGKGYISAQTGFNGDTSSYQVNIPVYPGNSGAPLMDNKGNIIGIVTGKQTASDGIAFAVKSINLKRVFDELPKDKFSRKDLKQKNTLDGLDRKDQIKKLEDFVYMVKVYNQ
ncbi:trypsin-like peptidase [Chitinophaga skermanii]|uniref:Trypsin-like peptidase n=1 Tax=Chitinophaga skermanii TaxID=331697 RepID=A0A327Q6R9_9BACT|nr:trypsin-like peptidase domain-containing protein [Chitinophaga skermanii]RAJ00266.1 trypsin-like peptidase [Chitinophaga skermanii]